MIKTTIEKETKEPEIDYPCLMVSHRGTIVRFYSKTCGVVLRSENHDFGYESTVWDYTEFTPFTGKLIMENEE